MKMGLKIIDWKNAKKQIACDSKNWSYRRKNAARPKENFIESLQNQMHTS